MRHLITDQQSIFKREGSNAEDTLTLFSPKMINAAIPWTLTMSLVPLLTNLPDWLFPVERDEPITQGEQHALLALSMLYVFCLADMININIEHSEPVEKHGLPLICLSIPLLSVLTTTLATLSRRARNALPEVNQRPACLTPGNQRPPITSNIDYFRAYIGNRQIHSLILSLIDRPTHGNTEPFFALMLASTVLRDGPMWRDIQKITQKQVDLLLDPRWGPIVSRAPIVLAPFVPFKYVFALQGLLAILASLPCMRYAEYKYEEQDGAEEHEQDEAANAPPAFN